MAGEAVIRKALKARVEAYGGEVRAVSWLGRRHAPDVLVILPTIAAPCTINGRVFYGRKGTHPFIETKAPGGKPNAGQLREHERMRAAGCEVLVISTLEQLDDWLLPL